MPDDAGERVIEPLQQAGKQVVIPCHPNRKVQRLYDHDLYKARHLIENFFARLKQYRVIATRYDRPPATSLRLFTRWLYAVVSLDEKQTINIDTDNSAEHYFRKRIDIIRHLGVLRVQYVPQNCQERRP